MLGQVYVWTNLAVAFGLELCELAAFATWGAQARVGSGGRVVLALALPLVAAVIWGVFASPRAPIAVPALTIGVKAAFCGLAVAALVNAAHPRLAVVLGVVLVVNTALISLGGMDRPAMAAGASTSERATGVHRDPAVQVRPPGVD